MKNAAKILICTFASYIISGCGGSSGDTDSTNIPAQVIALQESGIVGTWQTNCRINSNGTSDIGVYRFTETGRIEFEVVSHPNTDCTDEMLVISVGGTFQVGEIVSSEEFGVIREIDRVFTDSFITVHNQSVLDSFNSNGFVCPVAVFELDVTYDQSNCDGVWDGGRLPVEEFLTFTVIDGTRLVVSVTASSSDDRVAELDLSADFRSFDLQ